jgi:hypothetical protein
MPDASASSTQKIVTDVKVSGHLMTLETGLFCILQRQNQAGSDVSGLPGVRISLLPGADEAGVSITSFRPDGWLGGRHDAALVRVENGPSQILVSVYQSADGRSGAPNLQVLRLTEGDHGVAAAVPKAVPAQAGAPARQSEGPRGEMSAHVQRRGDVVTPLGEWIGDRGSQRWIEGFGILPAGLLAPEDIEYQAVLGRGWLSPWVEGGQFCGSRGMALPILGLRVRLRGQAADKYECSVSATFVDGSKSGPVSDGEPCEAESLAPLEAFHVRIAPRAAQGAQHRRRAAEIEDADEDEESATPLRAAAARATAGRRTAPRAAEKPAPAAAKTSRSSAAAKSRPAPAKRRR